MSTPSNYIQSALFEFNRHKSYGDTVFEQLREVDIHWRYDEESNSIALIVKHMVGNMLSRWTNFLSEDGEKTWRDRETEFKNPYRDKAQMIAAWEQGWDCLFEALNSVNETNFNTTIKIRNEPHTIFEAVNRQLAHYSGHVGQIVFIGKMLRGNEWKSPTIPKGGSEAFNKKMFGN